MATLQGKDAITTLASGDHFTVHDASATAEDAAGDLKKITKANLETELAVPLVNDTTPQLGGMLDVNGNAIGDGTLELLTFTEDALAVNHVNIENEATGSGPIISAAGDDTNIDLLLSGKGSGVVQAGGVEVATISGTQTLSGKTVAGGTAASQTNQIQWRADTAANFTSNNPTLASGEVGFETDTTKFKVGDGSTAWTSLDYVAINAATASDVNTGTATDSAVTPDALAGSNAFTKEVALLVFDDSQDVATGDGAGDLFFRVPSTFNGMNLVAVAAAVQTAGTTGTTDIQIHNVTDTADMLSTVITIDSAETDSSTAATAAVINTATDDVATGDILRIDVDAVSTTAPKGLLVELQFRLP